MKMASKEDFTQLKTSSEKLEDHLLKLQRFKDEISQNVCDDHYQAVKHSQELQDIKLSYEVHNREIEKLGILNERKVDSDVLEEELEELKAMMMNRGPGNPNPIKGASGMGGGMGRGGMSIAERNKLKNMETDLEVALTTQKKVSKQLLTFNIEDFKQKVDQTVRKVAEMCLKTETDARFSKLETRLDKQQDHA